jgi:hypothetical protein
MFAAKRNFDKETEKLLGGLQVLVQVDLQVQGHAFLFEIFSYSMHAF